MTELGSWHSPGTRQEGSPLVFIMWQQTANVLLCWQEWGQMHFCFNSCIPGVRLCVNFLQGKHHIWECSCDWNHCLIRWVIIDCHSPWYIWLCTIQIGILSRNAVGISTLAYIKSLTVALISVIPPGGVILLFWFAFSQLRFGQVPFQWFLLGSSTITVLLPWIGEPMWEFRQLFMSVPSVYSELIKITTKCRGGELDGGSINHLTSLRSHFDISLKRQFKARRKYSL